MNKLLKPEVESTPPTTSPAPAPIEGIFDRCGDYSRRARTQEARRLVRERVEKYGFVADYPPHIKPPAGAVGARIIPRPPPHARRLHPPATIGKGGRETAQPLYDQGSHIQHRRRLQDLLEDRQQARQQEIETMNQMNHHTLWIPTMVLGFGFVLCLAIIVMWPSGMTPVPALILLFTLAVALDVAILLPISDAIIQWNHQRTTAKTQAAAQRAKPAKPVSKHLRHF